MNDDIKFIGIDEMDATESSLSRTNTQVASCAFGSSKVERRRQSLRARLERESYERRKQLESSFVGTFRNLFGATRH